MDNKNTISLAWDSIIDSLGIFKYYEIYHSLSLNSTFHLLDSTSGLSYTHHLTVNSNNRHYYYILPVASVSLNYNQMMPLIDTISSVVVIILENNGLAKIIFKPALINNAVNPAYYKIYRQIKKGPHIWQLIDSTQSTLNYDSVAVCGDTVFYRVGINLPCLAGASLQESFSNIDGDYFHDYYSPAIVVSESFKVDSLTGDVYLKWHVNPSGDVAAYIIFKRDNGVITPIDTNYGLLNVTYLDSSNSPTNLLEPNDYAVSAIDSCGNQCPLNFFTGILSAKRNEIVRVYPNPATDFLYISSVSNDIINIEIYDIKGQKIYNTGSVSNGNTLKIPINNYISGSYFLRIEADNKIINRNIIIR